MKDWMVLLLSCVFPLLAHSAHAAGEAAATGAGDEDTYNQEAIVKAAEDFFGAGAEGLADVVARVFREQGRPNGYIKGEELSGAIGVGVRYGEGTLVLKRDGTRKVYWQGPSIGFDLGANAVKVFVLIYHLPAIDRIFQRFPGVEGSAFYVGGVGANYARSGDVVLAPIRFGVGLRLGINFGYMHFTREKSLNPL